MQLYRRSKIYQMRYFYFMKYHKFVNTSNDISRNCKFFRNLENQITYLEFEPTLI